MEVGDLREKLTRLIEKDGFYIILFICVCIVATAAVITSKGNLKEEKKQAEKVEEELIIVEDDLESEETSGLAKVEDKEVVDAEKTDAEKKSSEEAEVKDNTKETQEQETVPVSKTFDDPFKMIAPVAGNLGTEYTQDTLIYSETLEEWTAHKGIDIMAAEGTQVLAALSGTVQEIYDDPLWGKVIIIDHGNDLLTKYANLSEEVSVKEGAKVNQGDVIGRVGRTADIEMLMDPHIHFEVIENGISVNPSKYLSAF